MHLVPKGTLNGKQIQMTLLGVVSIPFQTFIKVHGLQLTSQPLNIAAIMWPLGMIPHINHDYHDKWI